MAFWNRITGGIVGVGVGAAARDAIDPVLETAKQQAWGSRAVRVLAPTAAAEAAARQIPTPVNLADDAKRQGVGANRFDLLTRLAYAFPGLPELLALRRRQIITDAQAQDALYRQSIPDPWAARLLNLRVQRLAPADVANAIQQGFIPNGGYLPPPPGGAPPYAIPVEEYAIAPEDEFAAGGVEGDRGRVLAELAGLPPGPMELLEMWRRNIVTEASVDHGIREGHTKSKWTSAYKALYHPLLNPATVINLLLRGWIEKPEADDRLALHGYTSRQVTDWFDSAGRPMAPVQAFTAFFRGVPSPRDNSKPFDKTDFVQAIRRSDIRPEYTEPLWGIRHAYPSLFQLRRAVQEGSISPARALTILRYERYEDDDAKGLVASWSTGTAATAKGLTAADLVTEYEGGFIDRSALLADLRALGFSAAAAEGKATVAEARRARTYRNAVMTRLQAAFDRYMLTETEALTALGEVGVVVDAAEHYIALWTNYREAKSRELTPAQVKAAYRKDIYDRARAIAELTERGYTPEDASTLLDE